MSCGDVTIVIPQRRRADLTIQCVKSLRRVEGDLLPVMVVDDGSGDDSVEQIRRANLSNCRIIEQPTSGVTAAWNAGLRRTETSFVMLLNNDVVVQGSFLERSIHRLRTRQARMVGVEWRREPLLPRGIGTHLGTNRLLAGWCLAFDVELWERLGGFDESLNLYYSDTDFQCRAVEHHLETGVPSKPLDSAGPLPLRHLGHQTAQRNPQRRLQWQRDQNTFLRKWSGR